MSDDPARALRERRFHDHAYTSHSRAVFDSCYSLLASSRRCYLDSVLARCAGCRVLELGCGETTIAVSLANSGAIVDAIDISPVAVAAGRRDAADRHARVRFRVMSADCLEYPDASFDLVCGRSILHHLPLGRAIAEVRRVLKPDGAAVFLEPLAHNPFLKLIRRSTPELRSPDEHPLRIQDLEVFRNDFAEVRTRYFHLLSLFVLPFRRLPGAIRLMAPLEAADRLLLSTPLRRYAWIAVVSLSGPVQTNRRAFLS